MRKTRRIISIILLAMMLVSPTVSVKTAYAEPDDTTEEITEDSVEESTDDTIDSESDAVSESAASENDSDVKIVDRMDDFGKLTEFATDKKPDISAVGGIVMDVQSGAVLYEKKYK